MTESGSGNKSYVAKIKDSKYYKVLFLAPLLVFTGFFFTDYIIFLSVIIGSMIMSIIVKETGTKNLGLELFTFATVFSAVKFGGLIGGLTGLILLLFHVAIVQLKGPYLMWVIPSYFVAGLLVPFLSGYSFFMTGLIVIIALQSFFLLMTLILSPMKALSKFIPFAVSSVVFNVLVFKFLGPVLIGAA